MIASSLQRARSTVSRRINCSFLLLLCLSSLAGTLSAQEDNDILVLEPSKPIDRELTGDQSHSYRIVLTSGQYLHVVVEQRGIDVVVVLFGPDGKQIAVVDSPNGAQGPEPVTTIAESSGAYRLDVRSLEKDAAAGHYEVKVEEIRTPTVQDRSRIAAGRAFMEGEQLRVQKTVESLRRALEQYEKALPLFQFVGDRKGEAYTVTAIGVVFYHLGERQKAFNYYVQALPIFRAIGDRTGEVTILHNIGMIYDSLGERQKALDYYEQALPLRRAIGDRSFEALTLNNIGAVYDSLGEGQKALDYYGQALPLFRAVGDRQGEATTLNNIGAVYVSLDEWQKALDCYEQALPLFRVLKDRSFEAKTLNNIGRVYFSLGDKQKALDYYEQALPLFRVVGDREAETATLVNFARLERDRNNLREALTRIEAAHEIIESLRTKIASQELRASYFETVQSYHELFIDILMRLHKQQPTAGYDGVALEASERRRARSLLELLAEVGTDIRQGVEPKLVERERSLQQQLNAKAQQQIQLLNGPHTEQQARVIAKEIKALGTEFQQVEAQIREISPRYAALTQPEPLKLEAIQRVIDPDTLLLEYSLGAEVSYLWLVSPTKIQSFELPARGVIERAARQFYMLLNRPNDIYGIAGQKQPAEPAQLDVQQKEMFETASRLSRLLLEPIAPHLGRKRLVIVADGALQYLPFAALPDAASSSSNGGEFQPLMVRHEIVNLPSISVLPLLRSEMAVRKPTAKSVVILADPVFDAGDERVKKNSAEKRVDPKKVSLVASGSNRLSRLKDTRNEAEGILALVPADKGKRAFDFQASRTFISREDMSQYRYVHFATHGLIDTNHPELSAIVLSLVDENGDARDGYLRLNEIFNLHLPAEVVVLSGCQTGLGKEIRGEGLVGLTRGFMYAGAARVVVSLWRVDDEATAELMVRFYRGMLREGKRPAAALRAAQAEMAGQERWRAPHYWAGFILQGEWK